MWLTRFLAWLAITAGGAAYSAPLTVEEAEEIAVEAYIYAYPMMLMDTTREMATNVARPNARGYSPINQWGHNYGADYLLRAAIAWGGLMANVTEDAAYRKAYTGANGELFNAGRKYVMRFEKNELPRVRAFWSLTMYNAKNLLARYRRYKALLRVDTLADSVTTRLSTGLADLEKFARIDPKTLFTVLGMPFISVQS